MEDRTVNLVARVQHFYDFMKSRMDDIQDGIITQDPNALKALNHCFDELEGEYLDLFKEFIYKK